MKVNITLRVRRRCANCHGKRTGPIGNHILIDAGSGSCSYIIRTSGRPTLPSSGRPPKRELRDAIAAPLELVLHAIPET